MSAHVANGGTNAAIEAGMDGAVRHPEDVPFSGEPLELPRQTPRARTPGKLRPQFARRALAIVLVCTGYYLGGVIGLIARFPSSGISTMWPATAILLAALWLAPPRTWSLYILALLPIHFHMVVHFQGDVPLLVILVQFIGNVAHAVLSVLGMRLLLGSWAARLDDWRGMTSFILLGGLVVSWVVSAAVVYFFLRLGWVNEFFLSWRGRSLSNGVGALTVVPLVLWAATEGFAGIRRARPLRYVEFAVLIAGLVAVGIPVFRGSFGGVDNNPAWVYVPLPFLLWAAVRFNPAGLCLAILVVALLALSNAMQGRGPFQSESPVQNTMVLQSFFLASAIPLLLLSAVMAERQRATAALESSEQRYRAVVESQNDLICRFLPDTTLTFVNEAYCRCFGRPREALLGHKFIELLPEPARAPALEHVRSLMRDPRVRTVEHEVTLPDGSIGWQEWDDYVIFEEDRVVREFQAIGRDITARKRSESLLRESEAALRDSAQRVRELASRVIGAQEAERTRIAMELHDGVSQRLAALSMGLSALKRHLSPEGLEQFARLQISAQTLANEIRTLSHDLHPGALRHAGLVAALRSTCRELDGKNGISITLAGGDDLAPNALPPNVSLCLYRVAQEALHNVVNHSRAKKAGVILERYDGRLKMTVCDDGKGFDHADARASDGVGLVSMEERVRMIRGTLDIDSRPGRGTELRIEIPIEVPFEEARP